MCLANVVFIVVALGQFVLFWLRFLSMDPRFRGDDDRFRGDDVCFRGDDDCFAWR
jgi:hypothetical protein